MRDVARATLRVLESGRRGALATVVRTSGSTPQQPGAKLLLEPSGAALGTIGGGAIERDVMQALQDCVRDGRPRMIVRDLGYDLGMCCGGRMEIFVEPVEAEQRLFIFGAGHVGKPVAAFARTLGFRVTVVDDRAEFNTSERFPECERVLSEPAEAAPGLGLTAQDWALIVTHDHRLDEEALDALVRLPHRYVGLIGSRRKVFRILQRIEARRGLPALDRVYAPVGLDIGAVSPEEIAVSVVAELVALRHGRSGNHLRAVDDPRLQKVLRGELSSDGAATLSDDEAGHTDPAAD